MLVLFPRNMACDCHSVSGTHFLYFPTQKREVSTVLADVIKHMTPDRAFEDSYPQVTSLPVSFRTVGNCVLLASVGVLHGSDHKVRYRV